MQQKIKNNNITEGDITEVFETIKKVNNLDPKELLKASNEIKTELKKPIDSETNIRKVKTVREEELSQSLPLERRLPQGIENNAQILMAPYKAVSKASTSIDDKIIRDDSGRIIGLNF